MLPSKLFRPKGLTLTPLICNPLTPSHTALRLTLRKSLQTRLYASKPSRAEEELRRLAREAAKNTRDNKIPERILIYHAGTGRTTFIALIKVTTLLVGAFFCGIVVPTYIKSDKPMSDTANVFLCGFVPTLFVILTTAPFVTHIHIHLPPQARANRTVLEKFVRGAMPPSTKVTLTTMSTIAKPRYSTMSAGDLFPARRRFGLVNYIRGQQGVKEENERRKWYMWRAVDKFYVQDGRPGQPRKVRYQEPKVDKVEWWIWDVVREKLAKRSIQ